MQIFQVEFSLDHNPDRFEIDPHVLAATITNYAFRNRHRWNAVINLWALGKWMVFPHLFCMGDGDFRRSSSAESYCLWSDSYLSAETEKGLNIDCCRLNCDAPWSCVFVENGLTNRRKPTPKAFASRRAGRSIERLMDEFMKDEVDEAQREFLDAIPA